MSQAIASKHSEATEHRPSWPVLLMVLLVTSAFGPYIGPGLRTDQVMAYGLAALLGVVAVQHVRPTVAQVLTIGLLALFAFFGVIHLVFRPELRTSGGIAMLDNLVLPIAVCLVTLVLVQFAGRERLLKAIASVTVIGACANAVLSITQVGSSGALQLGRWRPGTDGLSTGDNAAALGRFTGFLDQPALASILYGLAMLLAIYLLRRRPVLLALVLALLIIGGLLGISKTFLFVALPVCLVVVIGNLAKRGPFTLVLAVAGAWIAFLYRESIFDYLEAESSWEGAARLRVMLFDLNRVGGITGGRLGEEGSVSAATDHVLSTAPFIGMGPGGLDAPADSLWLLGLSINGLLGVVILGALLAVIVAGLVLRRGSLTQIEFVIGVALAAILVGASFGYPALYGDRLAVPLWATIILLLSAPPVASTPDGYAARERRVSRHTLSVPS